MATSSRLSRPGSVSPPRRDCDRRRSSLGVADDEDGQCGRAQQRLGHPSKVLRAWLAENPGEPTDPLFPASHGGRLSRDAVERLLTKHAAVAAHGCPTLRSKRVSPHVLRHTSAMRLLHAGVDTTVIALWLGHETTRTTDIYLHADLALKERALARTTPPHTRAGRYRAPDSLLAFLESR
jgi:site-specific recombinase XerC